MRTGWLVVDRLVPLGGSTCLELPDSSGGLRSHGREVSIHHDTFPRGD